jgi:hypothetical protein
MKRIMFATMAAVLLAGGLSAQSADSVSAASKANYYAKSSLQGEQLWYAIENRLGAATMATVNADGSPNIATVIPGVVKDRSALMFGIAPNQTSLNLKERKLAALSVYLYTPAATDKFERNKGARFVLELITDPALIAKLFEENKDRGASATTTFLRIVRILPIG